MKVTNPTINPSTMHEGMRDRLYRASNLFDIRSSRVIGWTVLSKPRGSGHAWEITGDDTGPWVWDAEAPAKAAARALRAEAAKKPNARLSGPQRPAQEVDDGTE